MYISRTIRNPLIKLNTGETDPIPEIARAMPSKYKTNYIRSCFLPPTVSMQSASTFAQLRNDMIQLEGANTVRPSIRTFLANIIPATIFASKLD